MPSNGSIPAPPPPLSKEALAYMAGCRKKRLEQQEKENAEKRTFKYRFAMFLRLLVVLAVIVGFSFLMAKAMEKQAADVSAWAEDFDYRHCWDKYDTPACHERKAKDAAEAYKRASK